MASGFPSASELATLRGWYAGLSSRQTVNRYLSSTPTKKSARGTLGAIRRKLMAYAEQRKRPELVELFNHAANLRGGRGKEVLAAIEALRAIPLPSPVITDRLELWLPRRAALTLNAAGMQTLADVAPRLLRRRQWWTDIPRLGESSALKIKELLDGMPDIVDVARQMTLAQPRGPVVAWEYLQVPVELDGSLGTLRAPAAGCTLSAQTDIAAVNAWLMLHEAEATKRAYRKEAERLVLWAVFQLGKAISSLTMEDALAYRDFLRNPLPRERWVGPARPRRSRDWHPFQNGLSPRSAGYAISVLNSLFRWLVEHRYLLANPFAGVKVRGASVANDVDPSRALTKHEWAMTRIEADKAELSWRWSEESAWRLRFILDFWLATGLRPSEMVGATLGNIERVEGGDNWLHVRGKGDKPARVGLPSMALRALETYLAQRRLPVSSQFWNPDTPLVPSLNEDQGGLTTARMWALLKRFFLQASQELQEVNPALADKLRRMSPHWLRHTHATTALASGVDLKSVRDNMRHASISTTSGYLNPDDQARARQLREAFT